MVCSVSLSCIFDGVVVELDDVCALGQCVEVDLSVGFCPGQAVQGAVGGVDVQEALLGGGEYAAFDIEVRALCGNGVDLGGAVFEEDGLHLLLREGLCALCGGDDDVVVFEGDFLDDGEGNALVRGAGADSQVVVVLCRRCDAAESEGGEDKYFFHRWFFVFDGQKLNL